MDVSVDFPEQPLDDEDDFDPEFEGEDDEDDTRND